MKLSKFYNLEKDGVTQGCLSTFQACREKARLYLDGWSAKVESSALVYGTIGHAVLEDIYSQKLGRIPTKQDVIKSVRKIEKVWWKEHKSPDPRTAQDLELALLVAEATLPDYFNFWKKDFSRLKWVMVEGSFNEPIKLDDGTVVPVRGKIDGAFKSPNLWLFETKFKSMINEDDLVDTLPLDKQINVYLWALARKFKTTPAGVLYNIVRRTSLRQSKGESLLQFSKRIAEDIKARPTFYFIRLEISISKKEIETFEQELKGMVQDFADWTRGKVPHYKCSEMCVTKYGKCNYLPICSSGSTAGFTKREKVFRELEDY